MFKNAGLPEMATREVIEGLIESSTQRISGGVDRNCAYTYFEVPAMKKLDAYMQARVGVSPIACFVEMSETSMNRLGQAIIALNNELMIEAALIKKGVKLTGKQLKQAHAIAKNKSTDGTIFKDASESWEMLRNTPAPVVEVIEDTKKKTDDILTRGEGKEVQTNIFEEELVDVGTSFEVKNRNAGRVVDTIQLIGNARTPSEENEVVLSA